MSNPEIIDLNGLEPALDAQEPEIDEQEPDQVENIQSNNIKLVSSKELLDILTFHTFLFGKSGSGKTFLANHGFKNIPYTAIFFNTLGLREIRSNGIEVKSTKHLDQMLLEDMFFKKNNKIIISKGFSEDVEDYAVRIMPIIKKIERLQTKKYANGINRPIFIFVDEIQLLDTKEFKKKIRNIALTGRNFQLFGVFISQRAQIVDKSIMTQCNALIGYLENFDVEYFHRQHIDLPIIEEHSNKFYFLNNKQLIKLDITKGAN